MKADMHIHSTVSDGSYTIKEIIAKAKKRGLDGIAITDHDTLSHKKQIPFDCQLKIMAGIEVSAFDYEKNFRVHVLGFNIKDEAKVEKLVSKTLEARHENSLKQIKILNERGFDIDVNEVKKADNKYIYKQHIMDYLLEKGKVDELFGKFYLKTFKNNGICHFDIHYLDPITAVRTIKDAGGIAVLAHSGQQQNFSLIPELVANGLDGLELNHHSHSPKDREIICEYAKKYSLLLTGGSDCHGRYEAGSPDIGDYLADENDAEKMFI